MYQHQNYAAGCSCSLDDLSEVAVPPVAGCFPSDRVLYQRLFRFRSLVDLDHSVPSTPLLSCSREHTYDVGPL